MRRVFDYSDLVENQANAKPRSTWCCAFKLYFLIVLAMPLDWGYASQSPASDATVARRW